MNGELMYRMYGQDEFSPIIQEVIRYDKRVREAASYIHRCYECGNTNCKGISDIMSFRSRCLDCMVRDYANQLDNNPEWIKRERVWKLRQAIYNRKAKEDMEKMIVRDDRAI